MQKLNVWTAGAISRKFRGLRAKNRTWLELFLNAQGLRVEYEETEGLFSKKSSVGRRVQILGSSGRFLQSFGPICDYFSKEVDCGLILGKLGGVFNKSARRTVMFRSDPLILDPTAQIGWVLDLI